MILPADKGRATVVMNSEELLHSDGHISDKLLDQLVPRYSDPLQTHGLPKVHKEGIPMRPIVSTIGSPTYRLAKEIARILTPLTGKNSYTVKNSAQFVTNLKDVRISPNDQLVSFDVVSLGICQGADVNSWTLEQENSGSHPDPKGTPDSESGLWPPHLPGLESTSGCDLNCPTKFSHSS